MFKTISETWTKFLTTAMIIGLIGFILWILVKTKTFPTFMKVFGKVISCVLVVAFILSGIYSFFYIQNYYKKDGGIYGKLSKVVYNSIEKNEDVDNDTITYNFDSLVFKEDSSGQYSIVFMQEYDDTDHRTKFENGTNYSIFVNNNGDKHECNYIKYDTDWIVAEYSYIFYNSYEEADVIGDDTLTFDFCFYENYSYLKITSSADYTTIQLWNAYFNKYNFSASIEVVDEVYHPNEFQENVVDGYIQVTQIIKETGDVVKNLYVVGDYGYISIDGDFVHGDYYILGWKTKDGTAVTSINPDTSANITLYADAVSLTEMHEVNFYNYDGSEIIATKYYQYGDSIDYTITAKNAGLDTTGSYRYTFQGWSTTVTEPYKNAGTSFPMGGYVTTITEAVDLYPVFNYTIIGVYA